MKSLLQFLLLIALVLVGKNVKEQQRLLTAKQPVIQSHADSVQSFLVQQVSYKPSAVQEASFDLNRKTNPVSLN